MHPIVATTALLLALAAPVASAAEAEQAPSDEGAILATRLQLGTALRGGMNPGTFLESGVRLFHTHPYQLELDVALTFPHRFALPGDWRTSASLQASLDLWLEAGPYLITGPCAGLALRTFGQIGAHVGDFAVPFVGWSAGVSMFRSRRFGVELMVRGLADLRRVSLVLPNRIVEMSRVEGRVGLRFVFGYGEGR